MEWVEVTGKTVEEAKESALDQLGVHESDAEFEVVTEAKAGLFGLLRSEARVRARVIPTAARPKVERRDRRRTSSKREKAPSGPKAPSEDSTDTSTAASGPASGRPRRNEPRADAGRSPTRRAPAKGGGARPDADEVAPPRPRTRTSDRRTPPAREGEAQMDDAQSKELATQAAEEFLTGVASRFSSRFEVEHRELPEDIVEVAVTGDDLSLLIGQRGQTLAALQELTRTVVQRKVPLVRTRIMVDVAGYREARREALGRFTSQVADQVKASGEARELEPMSAADRKVVHDTANGIEGVVTSSEGEDPRRRVIISPESGGGSAGDD